LSRETTGGRLMIIRSREHATSQSFVRRPLRRFVLSSAAAIAALLSTNGGAVGASPSTFAFEVASYAVATAAHDQPAQVVNAADVANALATFSSLSQDHVNLVFNLGDVVRFPRLVGLFNSITFKNTCIDFPDTVAATPTVAPCPLIAIAMFSDQNGVLMVARRAIQTAASHGRAVSGADVAAADRGTRLRMEPPPNFAAGQGGMVKFDIKVRVNQTPLSYSICLILPKTEFGLSRFVSC
jgi:hypothetical protein